MRPTLLVLALFVSSAANAQSVPPIMSGGLPPITTNPNVPPIMSGGLPPITATTPPTTVVAPNLPATPLVCRVPVLALWFCHRRR